MPREKACGQEACHQQGPLLTLTSLKDYRWQLFLGAQIMAHFLKPDFAPSTGYDVDNKLAPGSVWRMQIPLGKKLTIALCGGAGWSINSNNPAVVPNDGFDETASGALRLLTLSGLFGASSQQEGEVEVMVEAASDWRSESHYRGGEARGQISPVLRCPVTAWNAFKATLA
jgi:hypothetical protein